jgi:hypothetical protein
METMGRSDLMDRFDAVLPRVDPAEEAGQILGVMARICRASSAAVLFERAGMLVWIAGDRLPEDVDRSIQSAWAAQRRRVLSGTAFTEAGVTAGGLRSRLMWIRRPEDGGLDAVYFAGAELRPLDLCARRLMRLVALMRRVS